ncbi:MAG: D-alanyl-D-alanine carboxypeptidase family protein [Candidatus Saccharimonadales bacterium]
MRKLRLISGVILVFAALAYGSWWYTDQANTATANSRPTSDVTITASQAEQWVAAWYAADLAAAELLTTPPAITGDNAADTRIQQLAERRGYRLQPVAEGELVEYEGVELQPVVIPAWKELRAIAEAEGLRLGLAAGYSSIETERQLFLAELEARAEALIGRSYTSAQIASGTADVIINDILRSQPAPGYSKHHAGYAIDISDLSLEGSELNFRDGPVYAWLAADAYANARRFGFLPSYPAGGPSQELDRGEPNEFIWVDIICINAECSE